MAGEEKRAHQREAVRLSVRIRSPAGAEFEGLVENLGALGILVSTADLESQLEVGDRVSVTISIADKGEIEVAGEVLRLEQEFTEGDIRRSFAVKFDEALG